MRPGWRGVHLPTPRLEASRRWRRCGGTRWVALLTAAAVCAETAGMADRGTQGPALRLDSAALGMDRIARGPSVASVRFHTNKGSRRQRVRHATCGCKVGWVWRQGVGRAPPRAYLQADLDLITPPGLAPSEALLCDAEAIRAVIEARARLWHC